MQDEAQILLQDSMNNKRQTLILILHHWCKLEVYWNQEDRESSWFLERRIALGSCVSSHWETTLHQNMSPDSIKYDLSIRKKQNKKKTVHIPKVLRVRHRVGLVFKNVENVKVCVHFLNHKPVWEQFSVCATGAKMGGTESRGGRTGGVNGREGSWRV